MAAAAAQDRSDDVRTVPRVSLYLAATLYCDGSSSPVKIRNLSSAGALIELAVAPRAGSQVQLVRGQLIVHGLVSWSTAERCGLRFSGTVDVDHWRATPTNEAQQRVDHVVRLVKAGVVPLPIAMFREPDQPHAMQEETRRAANLDQALILLEQLGDVLADIPELVNEHSGALQKLDIAMQIIGGVNALGSCSGVK